MCAHAYAVVGCRPPKCAGAGAGTGTTGGPCGLSAMARDEHHSSCTPLLFFVPSGALAPWWRLFPPLPPSCCCCAAARRHSMCNPKSTTGPGKREWAQGRGRLWGRGACGLAAGGGKPPRPPRAVDRRRRRGRRAHLRRCDLNVRAVRHSHWTELAQASFRGAVWLARLREARASRTLVETP